ncbi:MAG: hypothetical protein IV100_26630 [Myxococcales bacterium]|nr:hypothetical protein [Myxococcales bacterium]
MSEKDPASTPVTEAPAVASPAGGSVVRARHVVAKPMAVKHGKDADTEPGDEATPAALQPKPRSEFHVNLQPMKRRHDSQNRKPPAFMSDVKI